MSAYNEKVAAVLIREGYVANSDDVRAVANRVENFYKGVFVDSVILDAMEHFRGVLTPVPAPPKPPLPLAPPSRDDIFAMIDTVFGENSGWLANTEVNGRKFVQLVQKYSAAWTVDTLRQLVATHKNEFEHLAPPPSPPAPVIEEEPAEVLESWQLPIDASESMMRSASKEAVRDLYRRLGGDRKIGFI
jgi:hypothetical protein